MVDGPMVYVLMGYLLHCCDPLGIHVPALNSSMFDVVPAGLLWCQSVRSEKRRV